MRLSSYLNNSYDALDIQFCLGVAVGNLNHKYYAMQLITYETQNGYKSGAKPNGIVGNSWVELEIRRKQITDEIMQLAAEKNMCFEYAAITWFFTEPILSRRDSGSLHKGNVAKVSLESILGHHQLEYLYNSVMNMLMTTPKNALLVNYIMSPLFEQPFKTALNIAIRNKFRVDVSKNLSKEDYDDLRYDFCGIYKYNLREASNAYFPITGNPNAALCGLPLKVWYLNNKKAKFQSIVFGSGQDMALEDGSVSKLNLRETEDEISINSIDFVDVCTRIYRASDLLFGYKHNQIPYDIYSFHCDNAMDEKISQYTKECKLRYRQIRFEVTKFSNGEYPSDTHKGKVKERLQYAKYLDERFSRNVTPQDLEEIHDTLLRINSHVSMAEGRRLFNSGDHTVHMDVTDSQVLEILTSGYRAMYKLIDYIERNEERTNVSVNDFPVTIFRDIAYLNRFNSFDEYITGHSIVKKLITDIKASEDASRRETKLNGFFNNEEVGLILAAKDSIKYATELQELGRKRVSYVYDVTHKSKAVSTDDAIATTVYQLSDKYQTANVFEPQYPDIVRQYKDPSITTFDEMSYSYCLQYIQAFATSFVGQLKGLSEDSNYDFTSQSSYGSCIQFLYVLEKTCAMEGQPVTDESGFFRLSMDTIKEGIEQANTKCDTELGELSVGDITVEQQVRKEELETIQSYLKNTWLFRIAGLLFSYDLLFGKKLTLNEAGKLTDRDFFDIFQAGDAIKRYLDEVYSMMDKMNDYVMHGSASGTKPSKVKAFVAQNAFLITIDFVSKLEVMSIPLKVQSKKDLNCLYTKNPKVYLDPLLGNNTSDLSMTEIMQARWEKTRDSMNRMLFTFKDIVESINALGKNFEEKASVASKEMSLTSGDLSEALARLNREILSDSFIEAEGCKRAAAVIAAHASSFDNNQFMCKEGALVFSDFEYYKRYYHRSGVACNVYNDYRKITHAELNDEDYEFIRSL